MSNMITKKDEVRIREIFKEELKEHGVTKQEFEAFLKIAVTKDDLAIALNSFEIKVDEKFDVLREENMRNHHDILNKLDQFLKKNTTLEQEQKIHSGVLTRHEKWIKRLGKQTKVKIA
jgi:hypothetical protein